MTVNKRQDGEKWGIKRWREMAARTLFALLCKELDADWCKS